MSYEDAPDLKEAQEKAPSAILKSLVEKLRNDLAEKDKKQRAMSREGKPVQRLRESFGSSIGSF